MSHDRRPERHWLKLARRVFSVRVRIVLLAIIAMTPLVIERISSMETARRDRIAAAGWRAQEIARAAADRHSDVVAGARALLQALGHASERTAIPGQDCNHLLGDTASDISWTRSLSIADPAGIVQCSSNPARIGTSLADRPHFQQASGEGGFFLGAPLFQAGKAEPELMAAYGKRDADGQVRHVFVVSIDNREITRLSESVLATPHAAALLIDGAGAIVAAQPERSRWAGRDIGDTRLMREALRRGTGSMISSEIDGTPRVWGFIPVPDHHGHLLVGLDEQAAVQAIERQMTLAYAQLVAIVAIMLLGAWLFGERTILAPIRALARHAERIGRGELTARTGQPNWATEFLPLARALDSMAERLSAREQDLRTQSEHFRELASVDSLTGLSNRRTFDAYAAAIWERSVRHQDPIGVLMIDVDYFKRFNDHYGHMHGDTCLRAIAEILQDVARPHGRAARYGGEEFALLLPGSVANARARAEAIRHAVMALRVPHAESPHGVATVSIGVAAIVPDRSAKLATLLAEADTALYASKQRRNAVSVFERVELAQAG